MGGGGLHNSGGDEGGSEGGGGGGGGDPPPGGGNAGRRIGRGDDGGGGGGWRRDDPFDPRKLHLPRKGVNYGERLYEFMLATLEREHVILSANERSILRSLCYGPDGLQRAANFVIGILKQVQITYPPRTPLF